MVVLLRGSQNRLREFRGGFHSGVLPVRDGLVNRNELFPDRFLEILLRGVEPPLRRLVGVRASDTVAHGVGRLPENRVVVDLHFRELV